MTVRLDLQRRYDVGADAGNLGDRAARVEQAP